jgi:hypothetical protein
MQEGANMTGMNIIEYDRSDGVVLSGNGVICKPGAVAVYQVIEQNSERTPPCADPKWSLYRRAEKS